MARSDERPQPQHGKKRPADGDPDGAQPLTKKFGQLVLGNVCPSPGARAKYHNPNANPNSFPENHHNNDAHSLGYGHSHGQVHDHDSMLLDDTKHTTYIHDLDRELVEPDSAPNALVILPIAERMLTVPDSVLSNNPSQGKELVLYTDPSSISVPREQDSVRRAIIESRARARARNIKQQQPSHPTETSLPVPTPLHDISDLTNVDDDDPMDIDGDF